MTGKYDFYLGVEFSIQAAKAINERLKARASKSITIKLAPHKHYANEVESSTYTPGHFNIKLSLHPRVYCTQDKTEDEEDKRDNNQLAGSRQKPQTQTCQKNHQRFGPKEQSSL